MRQWNHSTSTASNLFGRGAGGGMSRRVLALSALVLLVFGCGDDRKKSAELAKAHVNELAKTAREDVRQVRSGLPLGAAELPKLLPAEGEIDGSTAREALERARSKVADLRVAKSTFFALLAPSGLVLRNDREQDRMVGKNLFDAYPGIRAALTTAYVETRGSLPEAAEVRGRPDAQWVAAAPVGAPGAARALYVTGWSWSSYAYRLQNSLLSTLRGALKEHQKLPLVYVFVVVDREVYTLAEAPDVNVRAVREQNVMERLRGSQAISVPLELTGRGFGLAAELVPELGDKVAIVVLRSEV
jgi:hypothetical protein